MGFLCKGTMSQNHLYLDTTPETVASAATTLAFPPVQVLDVSRWNRVGGVLPVFDRRCGQLALQI